MPRFPGILLLLALYGVLAVGFSIASPPFEKPDELNHVAFVQYLATTHHLPTFPAPDEPGAYYGQEAGQPPLYYAVATLLAGWSLTDATFPPRNPHANLGNPLQPGNKNWVIHGPEEAFPWQGMALAVHLLRFFSILLGAGTLFFIWRIAQDLFPGQSRFPLAVTGLAAFLPQFLFITSAVSNDALMLFLAPLVLWLILYGFGPDARRLPHWPDALILGMFLGFAGLTKLSGLYLWPVVALAYLIHGWLYRDWADTLAAGLLTLLAAAGIAFPWYARNWRLYGDPTALTPFLETIGRRTTPIDPVTEFQGLRISLLGLFGWFNVPLPGWIYTLWDTFLALAGIGLLQGVWRRRFRLRPWHSRAFFLLLVLWLGLLLLGLIRWTTLTPGTQGRLLLPGLVSFSLLVMLGWREWVPGKDVWLALPPGALLLLSLYSLIWVIPAAYRYPRLISPEAIPASARREPIIYDGRIQLLGAEAHPRTLHPGQRFQLTLYWQRVDLIPYNASLYIHVLGRDFQDLAQVNTYPGWGAAPTRGWPPDRVLVDTYEITLPWEMTTPTQALVDVGFYDVETRTEYPGLLASGQAPRVGLLTLRVLPLTPSQPVIPHPTHFQADQLIRLGGFDLSAPPYHAGDTLSLTLYWQALAPIPEDYQVFVHLVDEQNHLVAGFDKAPLDGWWPTHQWEPGQWVADTYPLPLPADLRPGRYQLRVGLYRLSDLARLPLTGPASQVLDNAAILTDITIQP